MSSKHFTGPSTIDRTPVIIRNPSIVKANQPKETVERFAAGKNKQTAPSVLARKVESGEAAPPKFTSEMKQVLIDARLKKELDQKKLATASGVPLKNIQLYERCEGTPTQGDLTKLNRALGTNLQMPPLIRLGKIDEE